MVMLLEDNKGFCPWCKQGTAFQQVHYVAHASPLFIAPGSRTVAKITGREHTGVLIYTCLHCGKSVVLLEHRLSASGPENPGRRWREMVAPEQMPRTLDSAAPNGVRSLYQEASVCENKGALRGAGVLYRAAVEELVKDQGGTGANLYAKIDSLKGKLADELVEDFHEARLLGNDSIHAGISYSPEEVADVAGLIEEAVLQLYVHPAQKRAMRVARQARRDTAKAVEQPDRDL
jgi:hypothetical protein